MDDTNEIVLGEETYSADNSLLNIIESNIYLICSLNEIDLRSLYDAFPEDKIKCITDSFLTIEAAQKALRKKIKTL